MLLVVFAGRRMVPLLLVQSAGLAGLLEGPFLAVAGDRKARAALLTDRRDPGGLVVFGVPLFAPPHAGNTGRRADEPHDLPLGAGLAELDLGSVAPLQRRVQRRQPVAVDTVGEELGAPLALPLDADEVAMRALGRVVDAGQVLVLELAGSHNAISRVKKSRHI